MAEIKGGYLKSILRIDLEKKKFKAEPVDEEFALNYIGGRGWGARTLFDEVPPEVDPLGPENKLIIASGPLTGTLVPGSLKTSICSISPQTGFYGDSNIGAMFGVGMKQAGFDSIVIEEASKNPVYILVEDGGVEFRDASHLWGMGSLEAECALKRDLGEEVHVLTIGPAGENLVKFACITGDYGRQAGRTGVGAILGSKRLKAIAARGTRDIPIADMDAVKRLFEEVSDYLRSHKYMEIWQRQGTMQVVEWSQLNECLPTRNFQASTYEKYHEIDGSSMEKRKIGDRSCFACPIACRNVVIGKARSYEEVKVEGPEYETAALLGSNCALESMDDLIYANYLCDELGLDTISAGNVAAFAMECYEKGIIGKSELGGLDLRFGNSEALFEFLRMIGRREGIGDLFAEGVKKASQAIGKGSEKIAMHVKGLEITGYDHRAAQAMSLAYVTSDVGAHHNRAWAITYDLEVGRDSYSEDKVRRVIYLQHIRSLFDCLGVCRFPWVELGLDERFYAKFYTAVTGVPKSLEELLVASERIYNLTRAISILRGLKMEDDWLPERDFVDPVPSGKTKGSVLDREKLKEMVRKYYELRGWDRSGVPTSDKLRQLGLADVASVLGKRYRARLKRTLSEWSRH